MISGTPQTPLNSRTVVRTQGRTTTIGCPLPPQLGADESLLKDIREDIAQTLRSKGTPFLSVTATRSGVHEIEIELPGRAEVPEWIDPYLAGLDVLVEQLGVNPSVIPHLGSANPDLALALQQLGRGQPLTSMACRFLCDLAADLMHNGQAESALELLQRLPEAERIRHCVHAFGDLIHPISHSSLTTCARKAGTVRALGHMVAVALHVHRQDPDASADTIDRLAQASQRLMAPALTTQETLALDALHSRQPSGPKHEAAQQVGNTLIGHFGLPAACMDTLDRMLKTEPPVEWDSVASGLERLAKGIEITPAQAQAVVRFVERLIVQLVENRGGFNGLAKALEGTLKLLESLAQAHPSCLVPDPTPAQTLADTASPSEGLLKPAMQFIAFGADPFMGGLRKLLQDLLDQGPQHDAATTTKAILALLDRIPVSYLAGHLYQLFAPAHKDNPFIRQIVAWPDPALRAGLSVKLKEAAVHAQTMGLENMVLNATIEFEGRLERGG